MERDKKKKIAESKIARDQKRKTTNEKREK